MRCRGGMGRREGGSERGESRMTGESGDSGGDGSGGRECGCSESGSGQRGIGEGGIGESRSGERGGCCSGRQRMK